MEIGKLSFYYRHILSKETDMDILMAWVIAICARTINVKQLVQAQLNRLKLMTQILVDIHVLIQLANGFQESILELIEVTQLFWLWDNGWV